MINKQGAYDDTKDTLMSQTEQNTFEEKNIFLLKSIKICVAVIENMQFKSVFPFVILTILCSGFE